MLIAYYVIGIRNLSSVKIVTIVFILGTTKKLGPPLTFMDLVFTLWGFKLKIMYSKFFSGRFKQGLLLIWIKDMGEVFFPYFRRSLNYVI